MTDLVALVADLIPKPSVSAYVADWPQDEQDYYRDHRGSFTACNRELDRIRQEKAARAILAALGMGPDATSPEMVPAPGVDEEPYGDEYWQRAAHPKDLRWIGRPVVPLTPEEAIRSAVGSARLAGRDPDPEWVARVAKAAETPGGVDALITERSEGDQ